MRSLVGDEALAKAVEDSLRMMRLLIEANNLYVRTAFAYFRYREGRREEERSALGDLVGRLRAVRQAFLDVPGCRFQTFGVDQLLLNSQRAIQDLVGAERALAEAPTGPEIERIVAEQQERYRQVLLDDRNEALEVLHWEGRVDGRDILTVSGEEIRIEHLRWDPIYLRDCRFANPLPARPGTVIIEDIESQPMHPFVLQQATAANDYTARIYLNDLPGGAHWFRFNLYFLDRSPGELGLEVPWGRAASEPSRGT